MTYWFSSCSFLGRRKSEAAHSVTIDLKQEIGAFQGLGANVPISFYSRRLKPLQTFNDLGIKLIRVKRSGENWDDLLALRGATQRLRIKWIYSLDNIPEEFVNDRGQLSDITGFAQWWAEEADELAYQEVPADYIELLDTPDHSIGDSLIITPDQFNNLYHQTRNELDLRGYGAVQLLGPALSSPELSADRDAWYTDLDQETFDALPAWSVQLTDTLLDDQGELAALERLTHYLDRIDSRKTIFISRYATTQTRFGQTVYPDPAHYDLLGNQPGFQTYYYNATFTLPYGLRVYANTLAILKLKDVIPFIYQLYDAPADVKYLKESWGLLDLNGKPKPVFTLLSSLIQRLPKQAVIVPVSSTQASHTAILAFRNQTELLVTLCNEASTADVVALAFTGLDRTLEYHDGLVLQPGSIYPAEQGRRDKFEALPVDLKLLPSANPQVYATQLKLQPQSVTWLRFWIK